MEFLIWVGNGADLILFVDEVAYDKSDFMEGAVVRDEAAYPSFSRSCGNSGSAGRLLARRRNILKNSWDESFALSKSNEVCLLMPD